jgi:hypothetical protein
VDGTVEGLAPGDSVVGLLRNVSWKWPNSGIWKSEIPAFSFSSTIPSFVNRPGNGDAGRQELFPRQENIYSLGLPSVPAYVVRRLLGEPTEFRARAEMAVIHREVLAETAPKIGNRFGQGAERFTIVSLARSRDSGSLVMVRTRPLLRRRDLYRFPAAIFGEMLFSKLVTRADGQIRATTYGNPRETQVGPFAGVFVARIAYGISSPREYFPDRPKGQQAVVIDPSWWDGFTVIWTQRRPIARLETELVEPHFVTRVETPSRYPELRNSRPRP